MSTRHTFSGRFDELQENCHHGLGSFTTVALDAGELGRDKVVKVLRSQELERETLPHFVVERFLGDLLESSPKPFPFHF
jgi:hypothetical protein